MKTVRKIEQNQSVQCSRLRVAAYCRVSTDYDAQLESLETQKSHYENYIRLQDNWELANYASAMATTTSAISQLTSVSMHDNGGQLKAGEWGIVGEYGPELVQGPMSITSRKETAELARSAVNGSSGYGGGVIVNLYESTEKAETVETRDDDETRIVDIFVSDIRHGGSMSMAIQNTFNLNRMGS